MNVHEPFRRLRVARSSAVHRNGINRLNGRSKWINTTANDCNFHVTNNLPSAIKLINNVSHSTNRCWKLNQSNSLNIFNLRNDDW
ncbi:MAG: hypothetical protein ACTS6A_00630 [Candidatus Hodgkinia cicadicola]